VNQPGSFYNNNTNPNGLFSHIDLRFPANFNNVGNNFFSESKNINSKGLFSDILLPETTSSKRTQYVLGGNPQQKNNVNSSKAGKSTGRMGMPVTSLTSLNNVQKEPRVNKESTNLGAQIMAIKNEAEKDGNEQRGKVVQDSNDALKAQVEVEIKKQESEVVGSVKMENSVQKKAAVQSPKEKAIAEAKELLKNFDKSKLVYTVKGRLDRRYNINHYYLDLLEQAGESEESTYIDCAEPVFIMFREKGVDRDVIREKARAQLKDFNMGSLVYTLAGRLDMRYNCNKEYLRMVGLSEDPVRMANTRPKIIIKD